MITTQAGNLAEKFKSMRCDHVSFMLVANTFEHLLWSISHTVVMLAMHLNKLLC